MKALIGKNPSILPSFHPSITLKNPGKIDKQMDGETPFSMVTSAEPAAMQFPPLSFEPDRVPTWRGLVAIEPALADIEAMALDIHYKVSRPEPVDAFDGLDRGWSTVKRAFLPLVGWSAKRYSLRNSTAYDVAYDHLLACWENGWTP